MLLNEKLSEITENSNIRMRAAHNKNEDAADCGSRAIARDKFILRDCKNESLFPYKGSRLGRFPDGVGPKFVIHIILQSLIEFFLLIYLQKSCRKEWNPGLFSGSGCLL